jgi:hypothetical protein
MADQILIGNLSKGLTTSRLPFNIDNDAFPTLINFYVWRGRAKRKRGTLLLGQLQLQVQSVATATPPASWQVGTIMTLDGSGNGSANLISLYSLAGTSSFTPGSFTLTDGVNTYTEPATSNGTLVGSPEGSGTINYATGAVTISGGNPGGTLVGTFSYFPGNPAMGLEDLVNSASSFTYPLLLAFDTKKAYQVNQTTAVVNFYNVSFYKSSNNPVIWSGQNYQQFWTTNYQSALWATNNKPGLHIVTGTYVSGSTTTTIVFTFTSALTFGLTVGDVLWFNEWNSSSTINGITGTVSSITGSNYSVLFTNAQTVVAGSGIAQILTNGVNTQDGIKWYDGDPTGTTGLPTSTGKGWVNFSPPLTENNVSINNTPLGKYYLVGALAILPFKDRLLFFSPWIQTSSGSPIQLQDTVLWSWNGTPYYTVSDTSSTPSLVPNNETAEVTAYYVDRTGFGGWIAAGISQAIVTINNNEDVLLVGFTNRQTRFVYTGNDLSPFLFFSINSEIGSSATYSGITLDQGGLTIGTYGIAITDQQSTQRIDLNIPDQVFQIKAANNGPLRINSVRDYYREWIYFTYPVNNSQWDYPTQSFLYNYRDETWSILYENFTCRGTYRRKQSFTWATLPYKTWAQWREPWNSGASSAQFPSIVAGTPQGYVLIEGEGTGESVSGTISAITANLGNTQITSTDHCVSASNPLTGIGDYLYLQGILGLLGSTITGATQSNPIVLTSTNSFSVGNYITISGVVGMTELNGNTYKIFAVSGTTITLEIDSTNFNAYVSGGTATSAINGLIGQVKTIIDANNFVIDIPAPTFTTSYLGLGKFTRLSQPLLQTKQFNLYWDQGRQMRLSNQKYLMDYTANAQVTVNIYLSQDPDDVYNSGSIVPTTNPNPTNNSLIYSQVLYTCPESDNIGLTPANTNLQMPTAQGQYQIWHRMNTSLIGDSVQIGLTLSDAQMRVLDYATNEVTVHAIQFTCQPGPLLS